MLCLCKSGIDENNCCKKFIEGKKLPSCALELMRSRYYAYATSNIDYILKTQNNQLSPNEIEEIKNWSNKSKWQHLEIINFTDSTVEFKAYYIFENKQHIHHELSNFIKRDGKYIYTTGTIFETKVDIPRNAKCICGSGKKYKQCCLKLII